LLPDIVTPDPIAPEMGDNELILGACTTVNKTPLLEVPLTVTTTLPVVAFSGTFALIELELQLVIVVATTPLKVTVPCEVPKFLPAIVIEALTAPLFGVKLVIEGAAPEAWFGRIRPVNTTIPDKSELRALPLIR
jgi:hypothetical protein